MYNWLTTILQAMQYTSPQAVWNMLFGVTQPSMEYKAGNEPMMCWEINLLCCYILPAIIYFPILWLLSVDGAMYNYES
jgi:hypothetical protein